MNSEGRQFSALEEKTKAIYVEQHKAYIKDKRIFDRFYEVAVDPTSYAVEPGFFQGKTILDAGCGNSAYFQKAMYDLGAKHMTCIDIGETWIPELKQAMSSVGVPQTFCTLLSAGTCDLPFGDDTFDFVASNGVIMHLDGIDLAEQAFAELGRVTKPGGSLYVYVGLSKPGIVDRFLVPSLRTAYKEDAAFREFVDTVNPEELKANLARYVEVTKAHDSSVDIPSLAGFAELFTLDTCTFLQNLLQVPVQQGPSLSLEWGIEQFERNGFGSVRRVKNRYWPRSDVRKFLSSVHFDSDNPLTRLFYGDGHVKLTGVKLAKPA